MVEMQRQQIADFIKETTSLVVEWGFDAPSMHKEMLQLHDIIGQLIKARFRTEDAEAKEQLADLEAQARSCRQLIIKRSLTSHDA
jgi:hypothetical protein